MGDCIVAEVEKSTALTELVNTIKSLLEDYIAGIHGFDPHVSILKAKSGAERQDVQEILDLNYPKYQGKVFGEQKVVQLEMWPTENAEKGQRVYWHCDRYLSLVYVALLERLHILQSILTVPDNAIQSLTY